MSEDVSTSPVKTGDELDVKIVDVASKGDGIAKIEGFIIFVPGTQAGESCKIRILDVRQRFAVSEKIGESSGEAAPAEAPAEEAPAEPEAPAEESKEEAAPAEEKKELKAEEKKEEAPAEEKADAPSEEPKAEEPKTE